jgi:hypothetical protein
LSSEQKENTVSTVKDHKNPARIDGFLKGVKQRSAPSAIDFDARLVILTK